MEKSRCVHVRVMHTFGQELWVGEDLEMDVAIVGLQDTTLIRSVAKNKDCRYSRAEMKTSKKAYHRLGCTHGQRRLLNDNLRPVGHAGNAAGSELPELGQAGWKRESEEQSDEE